MRLLSLIVLLFAGPVMACDYVPRSRAFAPSCAPACASSFYQQEVLVQRDVPVYRDVPVFRDIPVYRDVPIVRDIPVYRDIPRFRDVPAYGGATFNVNVNVRQRGLLGGLFGGRDVVRERTVTRSRSVVR